MVLTTSCVYQCPEFPESKLKYVPYKLNDTLSYTNGVDTIEFHVTDYYKTEKHTIKTGFPVMDIEYEEKANYTTDINSKVGFYIKEEYDSYWPFKVGFSNYEVFNFTLVNDTRSEENITKKEYNKQQTINGETYYNCFTIEKDKSKFRIWKIIKADSVGIVEFYDRDYTNPWRKIS